MVTLLVAGIVLGFGVPSFMEFQRNSAMTSEDRKPGATSASSVIVRRMSVRVIVLTFCAGTRSTNVLIGTAPLGVGIRSSSICARLRLVDG